MSAGASFHREVWEGLISKPIQVVGTIQFLAVVRLRCPFSGWLSLGPPATLKVLSTVLARGTLHLTARDGASNSSCAWNLCEPPNFPRHTRLYLRGSLGRNIDLSVLNNINGNGGDGVARPSIIATEVRGRQHSAVSKRRRVPGSA